MITFAHGSRSFEEISGLLLLLKNGKTRYIFVKVHKEIHVIVREANQCTKKEEKCSRDSKAKFEGI